MGPVLSLLFGKTPKYIDELGHLLLGYLRSDDYSQNPHQYFHDIAGNQYKTIENFIASIPPNASTDDIHNTEIRCSVPAVGTRYVVANDTRERGELVRRINEHDATLWMDAGNSPHTLTERTFMQIYYWLCKIPCLRNQLQSLWAWIARLTIKTYNVTDLILEKEYLRSYLRHASNAVGPRKGIEGANNSCYLDAFLFSLFYTARIFDFLLTSKPTDTKFKKETRRMLRFGIVKPLREKFCCKFQRVWSLRKHLSPINGDLLGSFMDAEQVLYILCKSALEEPHFINYDVTEGSDWGDYMFLMTPDLSDASRMSTAQHILEFSFAFNGDIRMASVPNPALILGMPRSDRVLIHYDAVIPNPQLNIEHLLKPEKCQFCENGMEAKWEIQGRRGSDEIPAPAFICETCISTGQVVTSATHLQGKIVVSRKEMKLNAIICIRGCHFVAFVLASSTEADNANQKNTWYFFDSMAGGYPEVKIVPGMNQWLVELASDPGKYHTKEIPALVKRSLTDGHLGIYEPVLWS